MPISGEKDLTGTPLAAVTGVSAMGELWLPDETGQIPLITASSAPAAANYSSNDEHRARTPPPDLPSLLLDSRIVFLGMPVRLLPYENLSVYTGQ